jgi:hypothetical protein
MKMKAYIAILLFLTLSAPAHADNRFAKPFKFLGKTIGRTASNFVTWRDPWRNVAYLAFAASIAVDMHSTAALMDRCGSPRDICFERNPFLPLHPRPAHLAAYGAGEFLLSTTLTTALRENPKNGAAVRTLPLILIGGASAGHIHAAYGNRERLGQATLHDVQLHDPLVRPGEPAR